MVTPFSYILCVQLILVNNWTFQFFALLVNSSIIIKSLYLILNNTSGYAPEAFRSTRGKRGVEVPFSKIFQSFTVKENHNGSAAFEILCGEPYCYFHKWIVYKLKIASISCKNFLSKN